MQYKVLSIFTANMVDKNSVSDATKKIEKMVNEAIVEGWTPLGGIAISHGNHTTEMSMAQAMIKE